MKIIIKKSNTIKLAKLICLQIEERREYLSRRRRVVEMVGNEAEVRNYLEGEIERMNWKF